MIERYSTQEISSIWSQDTYFNSLFYFITAYLNSILGRDIKLKSYPSIPRIKEIEKKTKHEFAAVLLHYENLLDDEEAKAYLNHKLTSSDALDTVFTFQIQSSVNILLQQLISLYDTLDGINAAYFTKLTVGRTHGRHAEVIPYTQRFEHLIFEIQDFEDKLLDIQKSLYPKLSGPTGNTNISLEIYEKMTSKYPSLNFNEAAFTTQVVPRHLHADVIWACASFAASVERFSTNMRILSIDEIAEVSESFTPGQIGSSSMPHKKNPVGFENLCGISRLIRSNVTPALENIVLWFERDMSHSSVERVIFPDTFQLTHYMIRRLDNILKTMNFNTKQSNKNIKQSNVLTATKEFNDLLKTMPRSEAYSIIQKKYLG